MSLWVKLYTGFYSHRKTARLRARLGFDAFWIPPRLWAYCAENQPDGNLGDYGAEEIANLLGYTGDAKSMLEALLQAGFLDDKPLRIHDWQEHNGFHQVYAERSRKAASARWNRQKPDQKDQKEGDEIDRRDREHCSSTTQAMLQASCPTSKPKARGTRPASKTQDQIISECSAMPAYQGIDVAREYGKMAAWCQANHKEPTERRFINWLNRADRPLPTQSKRPGPNDPF